MQSINLGWFSRLANAMRPLSIGAYDVENALEIIGAANTFLVVLADKGQFPLLIDASRPLVWDLQAQIEAATRALTNGPVSPQDFADYRAAIQDRTGRLNFLLDADLAHQPVYHVFPKRAYDVSILTTDATQIFSPRVREVLTEEEAFNLREAGRCLAFEVGTAAGFHVFRALDKRSIWVRQVEHAVGLATGLLFW